VWDRLKRLSRRAPTPVPAQPLELKPYDVLVFPIVDWDFLYQRPQHLSVEFARRGHRVFYLSTRLTPELYVHDLAVQQVAPSIFVLELPGSAQPPDIYRDVPNETQIAAMEAGIARLARGV
jgi:hypothetical protein